MSNSDYCQNIIAYPKILSFLKYPVHLEKKLIINWGARLICIQTLVTLLLFAV